MSLSVPERTVNVPVAGDEVIFKRLRAVTKPSDKTMEKLPEAEKLLKNFTYKNFEEDHQYEMFKEIEEDKFGEVFEKLKKRLKLDDNSKESLLDILSMAATQTNESHIQFDEGKGTILYHQIVAMKIDGKINLGITTFTFKYELDSIKWWLFGFIPMRQKSTNKALTMTQDQKDKLEIWCQVKSFQYIDRKLQNHEFKD